MELGITTFAETMPDPVTGETVSHGERLRQVVAEAVLAEQVGLDVFGVGEHHRPDFASSAPAVVLASVAGRTSRIRLFPAVAVLSTDDPVRVYQQYVTLDLLSGGRAELLVGRGSFTESFPLFGYSLSDYDELFVEKLDLLLLLAREEVVTWSGRFRPPIEARGVYPRPERPLPIRVGVGGTPQSIVRAATRGLDVALAIIGGNPERFRVLTGLYRRSLVGSGFDPEGRSPAGPRPRLRGGERRAGCRGVLRLLRLCDGPNRAGAGLATHDPESIRSDAPSGGFVDGGGSRAGGGEDPALA